MRTELTFLDDGSGVVEWREEAFTIEEVAKTARTLEGYIDFEKGEGEGEELGTFAFEQGSPAERYLIRGLLD